MTPHSWALGDACFLFVCASCGARLDVRYVTAQVLEAGLAPCPAVPLFKADVPDPQSYAESLRAFKSEVQREINALEWAQQLERWRRG